MWGLLGRALYRLGRWQESRSALETDIRLREETEPTLAAEPRWWYLTMTLAQLGEQDKARSYYDQLSRGIADAENPDVADQTLRKEAAELLGITETPTEQPEGANKPEGEGEIDSTTPDESGATGQEEASVPPGKDGRPSAGN